MLWDKFPFVQLERYLRVAYTATSMPSLNVGLFRVQEKEDVEVLYKVP
jgi:hypothetical protein